MMTRKSKLHTGPRTVFYRAHPNFGFWGIPNMEREVLYKDLCVTEPINVKLNSLGNRDVEGITRQAILCTGGSHTFGSGVPFGMRFSEVLHELTGGPVHNIGHCSFGIDQVCLAVEELSAVYEPAAVVVEQYPWALHRVNNIFVNGYVKPHFHLDAHGALQLKRPAAITQYGFFRGLIGSYYSYQKGLNEYVAGIDLERNYDPALDPFFLQWKTWHYNDMFAVVDGILRRLREHCKSHGIPLLFALSAVRQQFFCQSSSALVDYSLPSKRLIRLLEKNGIDWVDASEPLLQQHSPEAPCAYHDGHLTPKGHRILGQCIHATLSPRLG